MIRHRPRLGMMLGRADSWTRRKRANPFSPSGPALQTCTLSQETLLALGSSRCTSTQAVARGFVLFTLTSWNFPPQYLVSGLRVARLLKARISHQQENTPS